MYEFNIGTRHNTAIIGINKKATMTVYIVYRIFVSFSYAFKNMFLVGTGSV